MREDGIIASNIKVDNRLILDVRQKYQYDNGHIEGSANIIPDITILNKITKFYYNICGL
ncbi:MAG: hypothetical protein KAF24_04565 [Nitrosopumilaceae archaeon]|nr:hypothetical protein [Nitrosopumilaceae archaeon]